MPFFNLILNVFQFWHTGWELLFSTGVKCRAHREGKSSLSQSDSSENLYDRNEACPESWLTNTKVTQPVV